MKLVLQHFYCSCKIVFLARKTHVLLLNQYITPSLSYRIESKTPSEITIIKRDYAKIILKPMSYNTTKTDVSLEIWNCK